MKINTLTTFVFNIVKSSSLLAFICFGCLVSSCTNKKDRQGDNSEESGYSEMKLKISPDYYDEEFANTPKPKYIVLQEKDSIMVTTIDRIDEASEKFFILDRFDSQTLVSFNKDGEPYAKYGAVGGGPGEYNYPMDFDIFDDKVFVLDTRSKKIIQYSLDGKYLSEKSLPFFAEGMRVFPNGKFLFAMMALGEPSAQLCIADSTLTEFSYHLAFAENYIGGFRANDLLQKSDTGYYYYRVPGDTIYNISQDGTFGEGIIVDFGKRGVPELAKSDFLKAREMGEMDNKLMLPNIPFPLGNGRWLGMISENNSQYIFIYDSKENKIGTKKYSDDSSIKDIIEPFGVTSNDDVIGLLDADLAFRCKDFEDLDPIVLEELNSGNRAIVLYKVK